MPEEVSFLLFVFFFSYLLLTLNNSMNNLKCYQTADLYFAIVTQSFEEIYFVQFNFSNYCEVFT